MIKKPSKEFLIKKHNINNMIKKTVKRVLTFFKKKEPRYKLFDKFWIQKVVISTINDRVVFFEQIC
jgi:hypothetical protein